MTDLEKLQQWLQTFPRWEGTMQVDFADGTPGSTGVYPKGMTELSRREDIQGNTAVQCRYTFALGRTALQTGEAAQWLLDLQNWVQQQDALGLAPKFGDVPNRERIRAFSGQLDTRRQVGSGRYTVVLTADFTKLFRGE